LTSTGISLTLPLKLKERRMKLFAVTWILLGAAVLHLWGDLFYVAASARHLADMGAAATDQSSPQLSTWGALLGRIGASVYYFAYPAMVELLYRIWRRLEANAADRAGPQTSV
jgi:hypothetical protein